MGRYLQMDAKKTVITLSKMEYAILTNKQPNPENIPDKYSKYSRLYLGNEFCERLMPSINELDKAIGLCKRERLNLSLVLPYLTDSRFDHAKSLISLVGKKLPSSEVIINDLGLIGEIPSNLIRVLGRLLIKQKRDPEYAELTVSEDLKSCFQKSNADTPQFIRFLKENNIQRIEIDNLKQGISLDFNDINSNIHNIKVSIYTPFTFISNTRFCMAAKGSTASNIVPCKKECRKGYFKSRSDSFIIKGNTYFSDIGKTNDFPQFIDRVIFENMDNMF